MNELQKLGVEIDININIPENFNISVYTTTILGNLLDNAAYTLKKCNGVWFINIDIALKKGMLCICCSNSFDGEIKKISNGFLSKKRDGEVVGVGLNRVKYEVEKYHGTLTVKHDNKVFKVIIIMICG
ncbi:MAG: GHKL domain-containing protein [Lachnospirales bacterium]